MVTQLVSDKVGILNAGSSATLNRLSFFMIHLYISEVCLQTGGTKATDPDKKINKYF